MRTCIALLAFLLGVLPTLADAQVPSDTMERIVQLRLDIAQLQHLKEMEKLSTGDYSHQANALRRQEAALWTPYKRLSNDELTKAQSTIDGMVKSRLALVQPQWAKETSQLRDTVKQQEKEWSADIEDDARKGVEFQRDRLLAQRQLDAGSIDRSGFTQRDKDAGSGIARLRKKYEDAGGDWAKRFDLRLAQMTKALASNPETFLPERQVPSTPPNGASDFNADAQLAAAILIKKEENQFKFEKQRVASDTFRETDIIYAADIARLRARYQAVSAQQGDAFQGTYQQLAAASIQALRAQYFPEKYTPAPPAQAVNQTLVNNEPNLGAQFIILYTAAGGLVLALIWWGATAKGRHAKQQQAMVRTSNQEALAAFGATREERAAKIDEVFDKRTASIEFRINNPPDLTCRITRALSGMSPREREALRTTYQLFNHDILPANNFYLARRGLIYGDGKGTVSEYQFKTYNNISTVTDAIRAEIGTMTVESVIDMTLDDLNTSLATVPTMPILKKLSARLFGDGGDLAPGPPLKSAYTGELPEGALVLGADEKNPDKWWYFDDEGSLITVAPSGAGKTQSQVLPNLLMWKGPAVVLDPKGEIYAQTSKWRQEHVGPVYKFSPLNPATSHCYNPLTFVRSERDYLWEDSRFLADMM